MLAHPLKATLIACSCAALLAVDFRLRLVLLRLQRILKMAVRHTPMR
jgi:hypothetical protein